MGELGDDWCAVDAYLDQAPDDVKAEISDISCKKLLRALELVMLAGLDVLSCSCEKHRLGRLQAS